MLLKNALIIVSACLLFSLNINTAEAGFLDDLKKKAEEASQQTKDKTKDLVSKEKKASTKKGQKPENTNLTPDQAAAGGMAWWPESPAESSTVKDLKVKGIKLGMLKSEAIKVLEGQGFQRIPSGAYVQDVVREGSEIKKIPPSKNRSLTDDNVTLLQKHTVQISSVIPSKEILAELHPNLPVKKQQISKKKEKPKANKLTREELIAARKNRRASKNTSVNKPHEVITKITYTQYFTNEQQVDYKQLRQQVINKFGPPNYNPGSDHARRGAAFSTNKHNSLWYVDNSKVSNKQKQKLIDQAKKNSGSLFALKQSFIHPCSPPKCGSSTDVGRPYPGKLDLQLQAARIMYDANMGVLFNGPRLVFDMAWPYLQYDETIRDLYAKANKQKSLPKANLDF